LNFVSNRFFFFEIGFEASINVVGASELLKLTSLAAADVKHKISHPQKNNIALIAHKIRKKAELTALKSKKAA